jgi:hypothetical protein
VGLESTAIVPCLAGDLGTAVPCLPRPGDPPIGRSLNAGQIYVTLARLEKAGLVVHEHAEGLPERPDHKVYALTPAGQDRVAAWLLHVDWPKPDLTEFHLKLMRRTRPGRPIRRN